MSNIEVHHSELQDYTVEGISKYAKASGVTYITQYAWTGDQLWTVFFEKEPKLEYHHQLFGLRTAYALLYKNHTRVVGLDERVCEMPGCYLPDRRAFVYSRFQHDYFLTPFGFAIDGGNAYLRVVGDLPKNAEYATFNPLKMIITTSNDVVLPAEYAAASIRELRGTEQFEVTRTKHPRR